MNINVHHEPPANIPQLRRNYTLATLFFLFLVAGAVILGIFSVLSDTGHADILENTALVLFVAAGFAFVYCAEKLLGFRRPGPAQQEQLAAMMSAHEEVAAYCRRVAAQGRFLVVLEHDAIVAHLQKKEAGKQESLKS